jgi:hypothetical protein
VTSATVISLITGGGTARIEGSGTIDGEAMTYEIIATDTAEPGAGQDSFTITVQPTTGPPYSAGGTLLHGNIQVHR